VEFSSTILKFYHVGFRWSLNHIYKCRWRKYPLLWMVLLRKKAKKCKPQLFQNRLDPLCFSLKT